MPIDRLERSLKEFDVALRASWIWFVFKFTCKAVAALILLFVQCSPFIRTVGEQSNTTFVSIGQAVTPASASSSTNSTHQPFSVDGADNDDVEDPNSPYSKDPFVTLDWELRSAATPDGTNNVIPSESY